MATDDLESQLIDEHAAAERLGVTVWWLRRSRADRPEAIEAGILPEPWRQGRRVFYLESEIRDCIRIRGSRGLLRRPN